MLFLLSACSTKITKRGEHVAHDAGAVLKTRAKFPRRRQQRTENRERTINKTDIIDALAQGRPREEARAILDDVVRVITLSLACGEKVSIRNFGKFEPRKHAPVQRRNPVSGDLMDLPEKISVGFVPSRSLKDRLNQD
jgi:nucleoid DNA-binding protein